MHGAKGFVSKKKKKKNALLLTVGMRVRTTVKSMQTSPMCAVHGVDVVCMFARDIYLCGDQLRARGVGVDQTHSSRAGCGRQNKKQTTFPQKR